MGWRPICESKRVRDPWPSLYFLGFFEDNDERGLRFAEHGRVATFFGVAPEFMAAGVFRRVYTGMVKYRYIPVLLESEYASMKHQHSIA